MREQFLLLSFILCATPVLAQQASAPVIESYKVQSDALDTMQQTWTAPARPSANWDRSIVGIQQTAQVLIRDNDQLRQQYDLLDRQVSQLTNAIARQQRENIKMRHDLEIRQREVGAGSFAGSMQDKVNILEEKISLTRKDIERIQNKITQASRTTKLFKFQLDDIKLEEESLNLEVKMREQQSIPKAVEKNPEVVALKKELKNVDKEIWHMKQMLEEINSKKLPTTNEIKELEMENKNLVLNINRLEEKLIDTAGREAIEKKDQYQATFKMKEKELASLEEEVKSFEKQINHIRNELKQQINYKDVDQDFLIKELARWDDRNEVYEDKINYLRENVALLKADVSVLRRQYSALEVKKARDL